MKKMFIFIAAMAALVSCCPGTKTVTTTDSTKVDSTKIDTLKVDSVKTTKDTVKEIVVTKTVKVTKK